MNFNLNDLKELLACARNNDLQSISIKQKNFELVINKQGMKYNYNNHIQLIDSPSSTKPSTKKITKNTQKAKKSLKSQNTIMKDVERYFTIVSPMVGTFYRSPAPNESAFINLNDKVKVNQTVCIVEAMKLMNEIEAEVSGEIVEILVKDGDIIDCGQALMKIKPE